MNLFSFQNIYITRLSKLHVIRGAREVKKGQFAMEYLLVTAFSLAILLPIILLLNDKYSESSSEIQVQQMNEIAREIAYQADKIFIQGAPARTSFNAYFPGEIDYITVGGPASGQVIIFHHKHSDVIAVGDTHAQLQGTLRSFSGPHEIILSVNDAGTPSDRNDDFVEISDR